MSWYDEDYAPYKMIGVMTTLPGRDRKRKRPIGFIWPKPAARAPRKKQPKK